jgi:beta-glucosidase
MSFPWSEGQIPVFYATKNTGRPLLKETQKGYKSAYRDVPNTPRFSFGYGLSYTSFSLTDLKLQHANKNKKAVIEVSCRLTNTGKYVGAEVVQLYLHDLVASVTRPIMELKDFQKVILRPGESRTINFTIDQEKLSFYNQEMLWGVEPGEFELMIGNASDNISLRSKFMWPPKVGGESNY